MVLLSMKWLVEGGDKSKVSPVMILWERDFGGGWVQTTAGESPRRMRDRYAMQTELSGEFY